MKQGKDLILMKKRQISAALSLVICAASAVLLLAWLFTFPRFFGWFYLAYHGIAENPYTQSVMKRVIGAFYGCAPFAAASLYCLIRLLLNILKDRVFIAKNVLYVSLVSLFCYAVAVITLVTGLRYFPLLIICFATGTVGTLLLVMKNLLRSAVELKEENELTI